MTNCDSVTGACLVSDLDKPADAATRAASDARHGWAVRYIGDPMCSWCWGISPTVGAVEAFCEAEGIYLFEDIPSAEAYLATHTARLKGLRIPQVNGKIVAVNEVLSQIDRGPV